MIKKVKNAYRAGLILVLLCTSILCNGQVIDSAAVKILDKAIGFIMDTGKGAVFYETVATNVADPMDIFSLPLYKLDKGGYWFMDGNKFEMVAAGTKALCDGELLAVIDENTQVMYVDSVREKPLIKLDDQEPPTFDKVLDEQFGDGNAIIDGEEEVKGRKCYRIKANMEKMADEYVLYWIDQKNYKLVLMAEHSGEDSFTVYEIKKVGDVPKGHSYKIKLPNEEISEFYGFQVIDMRYASDFLNTPGDVQ